MIGLWAWTGTNFANLPTKPPTDPITLEELKRKTEAEKLVNETGKAICCFCEEEIQKNELTVDIWVWESEFMLGFCHAAKDRKHKPRIVWEGMRIHETGNP